jgi:chloramphenicol 3-O phosphotransferase
MARQQALSVHIGVAYDLEVDTTYRPAEECARAIARQLGV